MDMCRLLAIACWIAVAGFTVGCSSGRQSAPVEGMVTLDGKPLADVRVSFQPQNVQGDEAGIGSYGLTDSAGKFVLKFSDNNSDGAMVGMHSVTLSDKQAETDSDAGFSESKSRIPAKYLATPMSFEVNSGGPNDAKFELTSK